MRASMGFRTRDDHEMLQIVSCNARGGVARARAMRLRTREARPMPQQNSCHVNPHNPINPNGPSRAYAPAHPHARRHARTPGRTQARACAGVQGGRRVPGYILPCLRKRAMKLSRNFKTLPTPQLPSVLSPRSSRNTLGIDATASLSLRYYRD